MESECETEINRQMLRRNKELEDCIKFQRETLQDQAMRIEVKPRILFRDQIKTKFDKYQIEIVMTEEPFSWPSTLKFNSFT